MRDFISILGEDFNDDAFSKSSLIYRFSNGTLIEFFSADEDSKLRGARRDICFINEANNISKDAFDQLDMRTRRFMFLDWNPTHEFWAHWIKDAPENEFVHSTYRDAIRFLEPAIIAKIESYKDKDPNNWLIYGEGILGIATNLVHPMFKQIDLLPVGGVEEFGLDFGYANDPTALVKNVTVGDNLYSRCLIYETALKSTGLVRKLEDVGVKKGYDEIYADCSDPRLIDEICDAGYNVKPAPKGQDSVRAGIDKINCYNQYWTMDSIDGIKEQRNYRYITDKNGKPTNKPIDSFNHAMDARRYGRVGKLAEACPDFFTIGGRR